MVRPTLGTAPTREEVLAVACPVERYVAISRLARVWGTLPKWLADLRKAALIEALAQPGMTATFLADRADVSLGRISQIFKLTKNTEQATS